VLGSGAFGKLVTTTTVAPASAAVGAEVTVSLVEPA
jgi:peroxiredoxin family protein